MTFEEILSTIQNYKVVPVVSIGKSQQAEGLAAALIENGLPIAEITLRTSESFAALEIAAQNQELLVGVGSLQTPDQLTRAADLGARFAVSAGFVPEIAEKAEVLHIPYFPGIATPTEILLAMKYKIEIMKFFPAESLGGIAMLKAMSAPFPNLKFVPTGGISVDNVRDYLLQKSVFAVGGSWMVPQKSIDAGDFELIGKLIREAREICAQ